MIGYGPEHTHFIMEVTYNYGINSYQLGNEFVGLTIRSSEALNRARSHNYPIHVENDANVVYSPDGYRFYIIDEPQPTDQDPVVRLTLSSTDLERTLQYWNSTLEMNIRSQSSENVVLFYDTFIELEFRLLSKSLKHIYYPIFIYILSVPSFFRNGFGSRYCVRSYRVCRPVRLAAVFERAH